MKDFKKSLVKAWLIMATLAVAVLAMLHFNTKSVEAASYTSFASFKSAVEGMRQGATLVPPLNTKAFLYLQSWNK